LLAERAVVVPRDYRTGGEEASVDSLPVRYGELRQDRVTVNLEVIERIGVSHCATSWPESF